MGTIEALQVVGRNAVSSLRETGLEAVNQWEDQEHQHVQFVFRVPEDVNTGRLLLINVIVYPESFREPSFDFVAYVQEALTEMIEFLIRVERPQWVQ